jgi:membrane associated rhomboid family serine protease
MLAPPSLKNVPHYPVTAGVAAAAMVVTGMWWSGQNMDGFVMNGRVWTNFELWRALTCTLPHVNFFHLAFNLYWVWTFGTLVEREYGHLRCAGIFLLLAFGSSLAEFTVFSGGVGLSGVGYGLWGMLWVLEKRDPRFSEAVDYQTSRLFVIWFVLCIVLTIVNVMPVANVAHGVGAGMGALLGLAASGRSAVKWQSIAGVVAVMILGLAGSTVFWPWVNLSADAEPEVEWAGWEALSQNHDTNAVKLLEIATRMRHAPARAWYNLGVAYGRLGRFDEALAAYEHAAQMPDADSKTQQAAQELKGYLTWKKENPSEQQGHATNAVPVAPATQTNQ